MKSSLLYPLAAVALVVCLLLSWFAGSMLHLQSPDIWILRGGLAFLSLAVIGGFVWYRMRSEGKGGSAAAAEGGQESAPGGLEEIDLLFREAETKLASARLGKGAKLGQLPLVVLLGATGSGKTSSILQCGLDAELLAGQAYQEGAVAPTRAANLWFARRTVFVEAGGKLLNDPARWLRLVKKLAPGKLQSLGKGQQAPRAVVVCVDSESLFQPSAAEAVPQVARKIQARLGEMSQQLGISFPVYVFFNRLDRMSYFPEFVGNMSGEEAAQVLGVTLPPAALQATGVYAEQETKRLSTAFQNLFYSLGDHRPDFLARERNAEPLAGVYEFPREFRKLRGLVAQFLVDACRPSQLRTNPFLRGFYFTGTRAVTVSAPSDRTTVAPRSGAEGFAAPTGGATSFLKREDMLSQIASQQQQMESTQLNEGRRINQWVFLGHLYSDVLLQDRAAFGASGTSTKVGYLRRALLITAAAVSVVFSIGLLISFFSNRALVSEARIAASAISPTEVSGNDLAPVDALRRLDRLRLALEQLNLYEQNGAPLRLRWGLYAGSSIRPDVRKVYFDRFKQLLFGQTQSGLRESLAQLPAVPAAGDEYGTVYDTLKAYLITTSNHDKSTRDFLPPVLLRRWKLGREVDAERQQLTQKQFEFYSEELKGSNPYSQENDGTAVARARNYLKQFAGVQRIYQAMLAEASKRNAGLSFNRKYPESAEVVINTREIPGAYSKGGWAFMQDAFKNPDRFFSGEEWVLGSQVATNVDRAKLETDLRALYLPDMIAQWRAFLGATSVVRYASYADAARKLNKNSSNGSPLLMVLCQISANTSVGSPELDKAFKSAQQVVPGTCLESNTLVLPPNQPYMSGLLALQQALEQFALTPPQPGADPNAAKMPVIQAATTARTAARQVMQTAPIDPEAHLEKAVEKLLEDPITNVLNMSGGGAAFACDAFKGLMAKFPFSANSRQNATVDDIKRVLRPGDGQLSQAYNASLKNYLVPQGLRYVPNPTGTVKVNPAFLSFFNRAVELQQALFPAGAQEVQYRYNLKPLPSEGIQSVTLTIDGQTLKQNTNAGSPKQFVWSGGIVQQVKLTLKIAGGSELDFPGYDGPYAVFHFFNDADRFQNTGSTATVEWVFRVAGGRPMTLPSGQPVKVLFEVDTRGGPFIFQRGYLPGMNCVNKVTQ